MTKIAGAILGLALLATPLYALADDASAPGPTDAGGGPQTRATSYCAKHAFGQTLSGTITSIGADWFGSSFPPFVIKDDSGNSTTEVSAYDFSSTEGDFMYTVVAAAYVSRSRVLLFCGNNGVVNSIYVDAGI